MDPTLDAQAYERRIGHAGGGAASLALLAELVRRHVAAIPFENIDVLAGRVPGLELDAIQRKLVQRRRGGYCFEQNALFQAYLEHRGFTVAALEARVRAGLLAGVATGRTHMALRVTLDGVEHLVDVGFGALGPMGPMRLDATDEQAAAGHAHRFVAADGETLLQYHDQDGWGDCYCLCRSQPLHVDFEIGNWYVATNPGAMLANNLLVARTVNGKRSTLMNHTLSSTLPGGRRAAPRTLAVRAEFEDVLGGRFGLELAGDELDAVMATMAKVAARAPRT